MKEKENYTPKFKLSQKVRYVGPLDIVEFMRKKNNIFTIDEIINYNDVKGYYPQSVPLKFSYMTDNGECRYLIGGRWNVTESDLDFVK
jgi:hypothetical protein